MCRERFRPEICVFLVNRHQHEQVSVRMAAGAFEGLQLVEELTICDDDLGATNTAEHPDRIAPRSLGIATIDEHGATADLPPASWSIIRLTSGQR